jgi:RES domain-containing protein
MPVGWRIVKTARVAAAFDGEGARLHGGRWNSPGTPMVYTAENVALATLEILVHLQSSAALSNYSLISAAFDDPRVEHLDRALLPPDWNTYPAPVELQEIGDQWVAASRSFVLRVPSAVVFGQSNYLINPRHRDFPRLVIGAAQPFVFDPRLL